jgi:hypothetical protein
MKNPNTPPSPAVIVFYEVSLEAAYPATDPKTIAIAKIT